MSEDAFIDSLKSSLIQMGVNDVMGYLAANAAWLTTSTLGSMLVSPIISLAVQAVMTIVIKYGELGAYIIRTDLITAEQASAYESAATKDEEVQADGNASKDQKAAAEKAKIDAARDLIRFNR